MEYTEEQIKEMLAKAVAEKEAELVAKHNQDMANLRKTSKEEKDKAVAKATEEAKLSAEELAKKKAEEEMAEKDKELTELKEFKKKQELKDDLKKAECPDFFINDARLLGSTAENRESVIKTLKAEWESTLPQGARTSTNTQANTGGGSKEDEFEDFRKAGVGKL